MIKSLKNRTFKFLRFLLLFVLGAIASCIFAPFNSAVLGYVALVLFFAYILGAKNFDKKFWGEVYCFSFAFFMMGFSWVAKALMIDGGTFAYFVPLVLMAMGGFFGLFIAVPCYLVRFGRNRYAKALMLCLVIVFFEWIRSFIFTGFPWNLFGSALGVDVRLIQGASVVGVLGLSFVLLMLLVGVALIVEKAINERKFDKNALYFILFAVLFLVGFSFRYKEFEEGSLKVRLVQPNIPQTFKWNNEMLYENFRKYIDLSKSKPLVGVDMVVWGETASPYMLDRDDKHLLEIREAIAEDGFLVTGLIRAGFVMGEYVPYNSLFVIDDLGNIRDYYDKVHLVPFGEFLPFKEYLPDFMRPVANVVGNMGRGEKFKNIRVNGLPLMGGAICYESIFSKEVINPKEKPELLVVLANDGWYGKSKGPYQHLLEAQLRAVEEGITVVRSANTGISAVIKPNGDKVGVIGLFESGISDINLPKVLSVDTIYGRWGNWVLVIWGCVLLLILGKINKNKLA